LFVGTDVVLQLVDTVASKANPRKSTEVDLVARCDLGKAAESAR